MVSIKLLWYLDLIGYRLKELFYFKTSEFRTHIKLCPLQLFKLKVENFQMSTQKCVNFSKFFWGYTAKKLENSARRKNQDLVWIRCEPGVRGREG